MTRLLLDTTYLIDVERRAASVEDPIGEDDDVAIAAITLAELRVGALLADARRREERSAFVDEIAAAVPLVAYDASIAEHHAELLAVVRKHGRPRGAHDLIIAATAKATNRVIVTSDERAFDGLPGVTVHT